MNRIRTCLWFDTQAEEAARFYTSLFPGSTLGNITHYPNAGQEIHGRPAGSVLTVEFQVLGHAFIALNGGPLFQFNESVSMMVECADQAELDDYWDRLTAGGDPAAQQCGWLKDRYGLSWQVVPVGLNEMLSDPDPAKVERVFAAIMPMTRLDVAALQRAYAGD